MKIRFDIEKIKINLDNTKKIVIYGAGNIGEAVCQELINANINVECFLVTDITSNRLTIDDVKVCQVDSFIKRNGKEHNYIVAVSKKYKNEVFDELYSRGIQNFIYAIDYAVSIKNEVEHLSSISDDELVSYINLKGEDFYRESTFFDAKKCRKIMLLVGNMTPRVIKIERALKYRGIEVFLIICPNVNVTGVYSSAINNSKYSYICENIKELFRVINDKRPDLIHFFSNYNNVSTSIIYMLLKHKQLFPPIIFEQYDVCSGMYEKIDDEVLIKEKFILENANGICFRAYEKELLLSECNINIKCPTIKFMDYIDEYNEHKGRTDGELSLIYAGHFLTENEYPNGINACLLEFAKICDANRCYFHLYPSIWNEEKLKEYIDYDEKSYYFFLHKPISYDELSNKMIESDYGVMPLRKEFRSCKKYWTFTDKKAYYGATNKIFDGLQAGIPFISPVPIVLNKEFIEAGVCIDWTIDEYDFDYLRKNKTFFLENVKKIREKYYIYNRIDELIDFYNNVLREQK